MKTLAVTACGGPSSAVMKSAKGLKLTFSVTT